MTSPGLVLLLLFTHGCFPRRPLARSTKHKAPRLFPAHEVPGVSCRHGMEVGPEASAPLLVARSCWDAAAPVPGCDTGRGAVVAVPHAGRLVAGTGSQQHRGIRRLLPLQEKAAQQLSHLRSSRRPA